MILLVGTIKGAEPTHLIEPAIESGLLITGLVVGRVGAWLADPVRNAVEIDGRIIHL